MAKEQTTQKKTRRWWFIFIPTLILLVIAGYFLWRWSLTYAGSNTAFVINGHQYTKEEVKKLTKYSESLGMPKKDAAKVFFEIIKRDTAIKQAKLSVSQAEVNTQIHAMYPKKLWNDEGVKWLAQDVVNQKTLDSMGNLSDNEGYLYMFNFSRYLLKGADYTPSNYNDAASIKADREYAKNQAGIVAGQLRQSKTSPTDALTGVKADLRLTPSGIAGGNRSGKFKGEYFGAISTSSAPVEQEKQASYSYNSPLPSSVTKYIKKKSFSKGVGSLQVGQVLADATKQYPKSSDYKDAYYFFLYIEKVGSGATLAQYQEIYKNLPSKYVGV